MKKIEYIITFVFVFLLLLFLNNTSKASDIYYSFEDDTYGTIKYTLPDNCYDYTISYYKDGFSFCYTDVKGYRFAVSEVEENNPYLDINDLYINCYSDENYNNTVNYYRSKYSNDEWDYSPVYNEELGFYVLDFKNANFFNYSDVTYCKSFKACKFDIINIDNGTIFFQGTPQGITKALVEETEKVQIMEQMKKMITGFLKYLAVLVISLLAFWKGWQFLSTQLRKA